MRSFPTVSDDQIRAFARDELGVNVRVHHLGGYLGRNTVNLLDPVGLVLKIFFASKDSASYIDRASEKCAAESYAYRLLDGQGLPVPEFVGCRQINGYPCILYRYVPGRLWQEHSVAVDDSAPFWLYHSMGELLAQIHNTPLPEEIEMPSHVLRRHNDKIVTRALELPEPYTGLMHLGAERLDDVVRTLANVSGKVPQVLTHGDFTPRNLILSDDVEPSIASIIDFERAAIADPMQDFAMIAFKEFQRVPQIKPAFLQGYLRHRALPDFADLLLERHLLELFLEIAGWARLDDFAYFETMLAALERLLDGDPVFQLQASADLG